MTKFKSVLIGLFKRKEAIALAVALAGWIVIGFVIFKIFFDKKPEVKYPSSVNSTGLTTGALAVFDSEGKVFLAGDPDPDSKITDFMLSRYLTDTVALDETFGDGGKVLTDFNGGEDYATVVIRQEDGKIIVAGQSDNDFALVRYLPDGGPDESFGKGGKVAADLGGRDIIEAISIGPDGKIVVAGGSSEGNESSFALVRFLADGSPDTGFGKDGKVTTDFGGGNSAAAALAIDEDGKIVVAGGAFDKKSYSFATARYLSDGTLDKGFGKGGRVMTDFSKDTDGASDVLIQSDGKIIAGGVTSGKGTFLDFALARYNADGTLDKSFGNDGQVVTDFDKSDDTVNRILIAGGKIMAAGGSQTNFALARYNADGTLDKSFGNEGKVTLDSGSVDDSVFALKEAGDKVIALGYSRDKGGNKLVLSVFTNDGVLVSTSP